MRIFRGIWLLRGLLFKLYVTAFGGTVGRGVMVDRGMTLRRLPHKGVQIGDGVYLGRGVVIDVERGATLRIGDGAMVFHYTIIAAAESVTIGSRAQVAEHCSIRDADHGIVPGLPIIDQPMDSRPVAIGDGAWIARGVAVLRGSTVHAGAVVGANAVVKGDVQADSIVAGVPARFVRAR